MESTIETEIKKVTAQIAVSLSDEGIAGDNLVEAIKDKQSQYDSLVALGKQRIPRAIELLGSIGRLQVIKDCCDKVLSLEEERAEAISSAKIQVKEQKILFSSFACNCKFVLFLSSLDFHLRLGCKNCGGSLRRKSCGMGTCSQNSRNASSL